MHIVSWSPCQYPPLFHTSSKCVRFISVPSVFPAQCPRGNIVGLGGYWRSVFGCYLLVIHTGAGAGSSVKRDQRMCSSSRFETRLQVLQLVQYFIVASSFCHRRRVLWFLLVLCLRCCMSAHQVKSSQIYLYSAFHNTDSIKAASQYQSRKLNSVCLFMEKKTIKFGRADQWWVI